ncbi:hypothetical protein AB0883_20950 [Micromonospora sp. NPDC047812]|uniref:hypothetical protein n=1 Tax=Micromonospora sp. NPDC047812 TaxID=3155742 RepID=UPI003457000A
MLAAEAPKITDWMQAWGSLAGLVMSTLAVVVTGLLLRHEIRVRREEKRASESAQARLVIPVLTFKDASETEGIRTYGPSNPASVTLTNHSAAPIFDVRIDVMWKKTHRWPGRRRDSVETVLAGGARRFTVVEKTVAVDYELSAVAASIGQARVQFTDAAGLVWERVGLQPPVPYTPPESPMGRAFRLLPWLVFVIYVVLPAIVITALVLIAWLLP